jgi:hypothetical protein
MNDRSQALANVFVEQLWQKVKREEVSLPQSSTMREAQQGRGRSFGFYHDKRHHKT